MNTSFTLDLNTYLNESFLVSISSLVIGGEPAFVF